VLACVVILLGAGVAFAEALRNLGDHARGTTAFTTSLERDHVGDDAPDHLAAAVEPHADAVTINLDYRADATERRLDLHYDTIADFHSRLIGLVKRRLNG
jgi:hypothetical protein